MRAFLALLLAVPLVLAGCLQSAPLEGATADPAPASAPPAGVFVHAASADAGGPANLTLPLPAPPANLMGVLRALGTPAFEPTLGVDSKGAIYFATADGGEGVAIGYRPGVWKTEDGGLTWTDVTPTLPTGHAAPPETNDPFVYVDPATDRIFQFAMAPILVCSVLSWSDDGGQSWTTNPRGCGHPPPWDHQSMVASAPRGTPTVGYESVLVQCVNNIASSICARSLDGGLTWVTGAPAFSTPGCGGLHGHPVASPDGVVYLPKDHCGEAYVAVSKDNGLTWETVRVSDKPTQGESDPAMAVDDAGNVYYVFVDDEGALWMSVSSDEGATWSEAVMASPPGVTTHVPTLAAGSAGRIALAYPGTEDLPKGYASAEKLQEGARWNAYMAYSVDAASGNATFVTARLNDPADPIVRGPCGPGRCPGIVDFIDVVIAPDGTPYAAFVDACTDGCTANGEGLADNNASEAVLGTLVGAPSLREAAPEAEAEA